MHFFFSFLIFIYFQVMNQTHVQKVRILYKTIHRLHRGLPPELQILGHQYVRDEFRRHKGCNPSEAQVFMNEWAVSTKKKMTL